MNYIHVLNDIKIIYVLQNRVSIGQNLYTICSLTTVHGFTISHHPVHTFGLTSIFIPDCNL